MKKIFILTGEPSGDRLASKVISKIKNTKPDIEYLSVGGENLKNLGIKTIFAKYGDHFGVKESGANWDIENISEIVDIIDGINNE